MLKFIEKLLKGFIDDNSTSKTMTPLHILVASRKDIREYIDSQELTKNN